MSIKRFNHQLEWDQQEEFAKEIGETETEKRNRLAVSNFMKFLGFVLFVKLIF